MKEDKKNKEEAKEKFIQFAAKANLGYLLISGGGEPLNQKKHILELVQHVPTDRVVLVTSGNWAKNYEGGLKYIHDLHDSFQKRKSKTKLLVRVSISEGHAIKLGINSALNLIKIFDKHFANSQDFCLQIKTFRNDRTLSDLLNAIPGAILENESKKLIVL